MEVVGSCGQLLVCVCVLCVVETRVWLAQGRGGSAPTYFSIADEDLESGQAGYCDEEYNLLAKMGTDNEVCVC